MGKQAQLGSVHPEEEQGQSKPNAPDTIAAGIRGMTIASIN